MYSVATTGETVDSSEDNAKNIEQFRVILLLIIAGKIFFIISCRLTEFLPKNRYIDTSVQNGGILKIPGCLELTGLVQTEKTLEHILSCCPKALGEGQYNWHHDQVLKAIAEAISNGITQSKPLRPARKAICFCPASCPRNLRNHPEARHSAILRFLITGEALVCQTCTTSACTATVPKTCSSDTMCITASIQAIGSFTYSVNLGVSSALASATCCNTDNCNSATLAVPAAPADNSLQCNSCDNVTCTVPIQCKGTEDRCFQVSGAALVCQTCTTSACTATVPMTCSSETMCITASIQAISSEAFSVNLGVSSGLASAACCNTDNCNSANVPYPGDPDVNTLLCYSCDPLTSQCTSLLQCKGAEDRCIKASVTNGSTTTPAFGCATNNMCEAAASSGQLPFFESVGNVTGAACCTDSLCNTLTPTTTTSAASDTCRIRLTMIHLLIGLLVFTLY
ncbi:hypothetical protein F2P81_005198 [Scophthalmus maximus]|uniref:UPAR/Ly6 domain-containing protein n=1 Tax=Scophthalmus maximus TaxID=52904 RepID=A0A6A4T2H3_SCOMX|nr:hypothetical protein F2P81_005198 [Scophthalmus maximus]